MPVPCTGEEAIERLEGERANQHHSRSVCKNAGRQAERRLQEDRYPEVCIVGVSKKKTRIMHYRPLVLEAYLNLSRLGYRGDAASSVSAALFNWDLPSPQRQQELRNEVDYGSHTLWLLINLPFSG